MFTLYCDRECGTRGLGRHSYHFAVTDEVNRPCCTAALNGHDETHGRVLRNCDRSPKQQTTYGYIATDGFNFAGRIMQLETKANRVLQIETPMLAPLGMRRLGEARHMKLDEKPGSDDARLAALAPPAWAGAKSDGTCPYSLSRPE
jgi:hypothetical protein